MGPTNNTTGTFSTWDTQVQGGGGHRMSFQADLPPTWDYPLFVEMAQLATAFNGLGEEWKEAARWVKYEEDIEEGGRRWSKPYVSSINVSAITKLQSILESGYVDLAFNCENEEQLCRTIVENWLNDGSLMADDRCKVLQSLFRPHIHLYETSTSIIPEFLKRRTSSHNGSQETVSTNTNTNTRSNNARRGSLLSVVYQPQTKEDKEKNKNFLRKIPQNAECGNIMVGPLSILTRPLAAFLRLTEPKVIGNYTEVPIPTRFIFILLTPPGWNYLDIGRGMGILLTDPGFRELAYRTSSKETLLKGIHKFLQSTSILPPAIWDASIRLEPHQDGTSPGGSEHDGDDGNEQQDNGLMRTGKLFGGLIQDLKRKIPFYPSDFRDALSLQVLATWLFLYFACLTPQITFGGLMGEATHKMMGTMETLLSGCICGVGFALFSGQPLLILGSTGPVLIFEKILVRFAESNEFDYMEFRLWVGLWITGILLILVATDASAWVRYITRFTEDNFATLIACIFMFEAIKNIINIKNQHVVLTNFDLNSSDPSPYLEPLNDTMSNNLYHRLEDETRTSLFLMSLLLFFSTFFVCYMLKEFRVSSFFPTWFRYLISDFAVILAILLMTMIDYFAKVATPKLQVPQEFAPTSDQRGWFIPPTGKNPLWSVFAASIPALLATILIFMDQQITAVIINRKDHKLQKGGGYHLDLFILAILIAIGSLFGLPWFVAATVESLTNVNSLKMESETAAPGEKPTFLGVREQRVSNLLVFTTIGFSVFLTPILKHVPMPVLYGVFLYMGFSALMRMELFHRILLLFMPVKYQPDYRFLRQVPLKRVHLFTIIQVLCLAILWIIKSIPATAIGFPLMLVVMMVVRKLLDYVFTQHELLALDDQLPPIRSKKKSEKGKMKEGNKQQLQHIVTT